MKDGQKIALLVAAVAGWGVAVVLAIAPPQLGTFGAGRPTASHDIHHGDETPAVPIIELKDLVNVGIRPGVIRMIEPHFYVLNAALVKLVGAHAEYDSATSPSARTAIAQKATTFHATAHRHEEQIEQVLTPGERVRFHTYIRDREIGAGLPRDSAWHVH